MAAEHILFCILRLETSEDLPLRLVDSTAPLRGDAM